MPRCYREELNFHWYWLLGLMVTLSLLPPGGSQLLVRSVESGAVFPNPRNIVVGLTSDLIIEVQCAAENGIGTEVFTWSQNATTVPSGLQTFGVSQGGNGILRGNPAQELLQPGGNQFVCSDNSGNTLDVVFIPAEDLFFLSPPPSVTVPDIPALNVTRVDGNGVLFYTAVGERGVYRNDPLTIPTFRYEPFNILRPSTAAFACSIINPSNIAVTFRWHFSSGGIFTLINDAPDDQVTILDASEESSSRLSDLGTSILILESPSDANAGLYFCEVDFGSGSLNSSLAQLFITGAPVQIILFPPSFFGTVSVGEDITIPCVTSDLSVPEFQIVSGNASEPQVSTAGGTFAATTAGEISFTCSVGSEMRSGSIDAVESTLEESLLSASVDGVPVTNGVQELVVREGVSVQLNCSAPGLMVVNNVISTSSSFQTESVRRDQAGFYQCLAEDSVDSVYLLVTYVDVPMITQPDSTPLFSCSSLGNPTPRLSWSIAPRIPLENISQTPTGFGEPATSTVSVDISSVTVTEYIITCTSEVNVDGNSPLNASSTFNFTVFLEEIRIEGPDSIVLGDMLTVVCSVRASLVPLISITFGRTVNASADVTSVGLEHRATLTINDSSQAFTPGTQVVTCDATLGIDGIPTLSVNATFDVIVVFENITVSPPEIIVNSTQGLDQSGNITLTCSLASSQLPVITWTRDDMEGVELNGTTPTLMDGLVESQLTVILSGVRGVVTFTCTATLRTEPSMSANATITHNFSPEFTVNPMSLVTVAEGDNVTLTCTAEGFPAPTITWEDEDGEISSDITNGTFEIVSEPLPPFTFSSYLSFNASEQDPLTSNGSMFFCVAMNSLSPRNESESSLLVIADPPGQPGNFTFFDPTSSSVVLEWSAAPSPLPLTGYRLSIIQTRSSSGMALSTLERDLGPDDFNDLVSRLEPFSEYRAELAAVSRAGAGIAVVLIFETLQGVPGPPVNIATGSPSLGVIIVTWEPTPVVDRNGNLTQYTVQFQVEGMAGSMEMESTEGSMFSLTLENLSSGTTYLIQVAAHTVVGMGVFSTPLTQVTISDPPSLDGVAGFAVDMTREGGITQTTIPITLPVIPNVETAFSHLWVIAMKLADNAATPSMSFTNNATFVFSSGDVRVNEPYVTLEIRASRYDAARDYVLGDNSSFSMFNDQPQRYINGPLEEGTTYTVFVWAFLQRPMDGSPAVTRARRHLTRRQTTTDTVRQYTVFSATPFLTSVSTSSSSSGGGGGIGGGGIAGVVIAIVIVILLVVAIVIVAAILYDRFRYQSELGPPPSRKGSMRLRDQNEIVRGSLRSSFRIITLRNQKAEAELQDLNPDDARLPVSVYEFQDYVKSMHKNTDHLFSEEYEIVSIKSPSLSHIQCSLPSNVSKNRYANINCYDNSRVALEVNPDTNSGDYINANYIDGYKLRYAYIASQGPLANTTHDFWRMVWEQESCCIIMLTNLIEKSRVKCHQYWPEVGSISMGDITIDLVEVQQLAYYTIRTLRLTKHDVTREIKQFHYTGWPDFGVPDYPHPVLAFNKRLARFKRTTEGPDIIHCSAGVGRTGTLITIQAMMEMAKEEEMLDVFNFVLGMRQQRNYMVQTERQYIFIHDTVLEYIKMGDTEIPMQSLRGRYKKLLAHNPKTDSSLMEDEYGHLNELEEVDESQYQPAKNSINMPKNRFKTILPYDRYRVRLLLHPGVSGSDYINACYVDGYQRRHQYILTQGPMSNTATDFWRMVWEHRCSCIMMLCQCEEGGEEQSVCYWPTDKVRQHGDMFIEQTSVTEHTGYVLREFAITNTKINESRVVKHFQYCDWLEKQAPSTAATVIDLIGVLQKTQHTCGGGPIIVHDNTSIGRSGTFVVLSSVLEQLKVEGVVDPFSTINCLRQQQPGIVNAFEQYRFCYQAVIEFLDSFDHYSNFD